MLKRSVNITDRLINNLSFDDWTSEFGMKPLRKLADRRRVLYLDRTPTRSGDLNRCTSPAAIVEPSCQDFKPNATIGWSNLALLFNSPVWASPDDLFDNVAAEGGFHHRTSDKTHLKFITCALDVLNKLNLPAGCTGLFSFIDPFVEDAL